jgi:predicted permease
METWIQDLWYAGRLLIKKPGFASVAVLSLAVGIGANTAIFTVINAVFLHPLQIEEPSRVVELFTHDTRTLNAQANSALTPTSLPNFEDYRDHNTVFSGLAAYSGVGLTWTNNGEAVGLPGMLASANYFDVLGVKAFQGRTFLTDEDRKPGANTVAVLSHSLWTRQFGADPTLIGKTLTFNGIAFTVIGIAPPNFKGTFSLAGPDRVWVPLSMWAQLTTGQLKQLAPNRRFRWLNVVGRLRPGVTVRQAEAAMQTVAASLETQYPVENKGRTVALALQSHAALGINQRSQFVLAGGVMMGVVSLVLLIACVNLANLLLAQSAQREREISLRSALGASRSRLVRQLLTESLLLSVLGGLAGLAVAYWGRNALWSFRPPFLGNAAIDLSFDTRVLLFTTVVTVVTGVLFGLAPAIRISRANLSEMLKIGGRSGSSLAHARMRSLLVVAEIGLAAVALIGSGLFVRSMQAAQNIDLGFDSKHTGFLRLNPGSQKYDMARGLQFYRDAIARARLAPGVEAAAVASSAPLNGGILLTVFAEGQQGNPGSRGTLTLFTGVSPGYFDTMRIPMRKGRDFTEFDREGSQPVAIVNEAMARGLWPGQDAVGRHFTIVQDPTMYEVVGVAATSVLFQIGEAPQPVVYRPVAQDYAPGTALIVRATADPESVLGEVRSQVQTLDPNMRLTDTGTVQETIAQGLWAPRMGAALLSIFGGLALALAMIGVYGVISYSVSQRTQEIGVRMALGAQAPDVLRLMLRQGMLLAFGGTATGLVAGFLAARVVSGLLYGISPKDPLTFGVVGSVLLAVAFLACYVPARRATRVDPLVALRTE